MEQEEESSEEGKRNGEVNKDKLLEEVKKKMPRTTGWVKLGLVVN